MANILHVCVLVTLGVIVGGTKTISELYCQDPDTGKLYELNSTWPSKTFCGNYTCKLSKKNITNTEYAPLKRININDLQLDTDDKLLKSKAFEINNNSNPSKNTKTAPSLNEILMPKSHTGTKPISQNDMIVSPSEISATVKDPDENINIKNEIINKLMNDTKASKGLNDDDRYLSDEEVRAITSILYSVKRSDLKAIVDIYDLAEEIYNEMEGNKKTSYERFTQNGLVYDLHNQNNFNSFNRPKYWHNEKEIGDVKDVKFVNTPKLPTLNAYDYPVIFWKGPLTQKDFGVIPYYYPMSGFQRMSSYVYPTLSNEKKPQLCSKVKDNSVAALSYSKSEKNKVAPEKKMSTTILPYPYSNVNQYNQNGYNTRFYYNNYPWAQLDIYNRNKNYKHPFLNAFFPKIHSSFPENSKKVEPKQEQRDQYKQTEGTSMIKIPTAKKTKELPTWQTEPLSAKVLEEVKANIMDKKKLINLFPRKNVQIEKVGKVIKIDELREKRQVQIFAKRIPDDYEVQLTKIVCETGSEPGYFSYGNLSAAYPACCPQKIKLE